MGQLNLYGDTGLVTLYDVAARLGKDGDLAGQAVVELQAQTNQFWQVCGMKECNNGTKETVVLRDKLPATAWRMLNGGVKPVKSGYEQVTYTTGGKEAYSQVDERILQMQKNSNAYRLSEAQGVQMGMSNDMMQTVFYGDEKINPAGFTGFGAYYNKIGTDTVWERQVIDGGGTGNSLTSMWFVTFSMETVYGIHPQGVPGGYRHNNNGRVKIFDAKDPSKFYYGKEDQFNWDFGLAIRDPRYVVRLANIDVTNRDDSEMIRKIVEAYGQIENPDKGYTAILCNRKMETYLNILAMEKSNVNLTVEEFAGKKITHFYGAPILRNDAILTTESQIQ